MRQVHPAEQAPQEVLRHRYFMDTFIIGSKVARGMSSQHACRLLRPWSMPDRNIMLLLMACHSVLAAQGTYIHGLPLHIVFQSDCPNK